MDPHNFSIYACGVCGLLMVAGSIWLLKSGVIKLNAAAKRGNLSVELWKKIKINTTYPALGLFIIGLLFIALGLWSSKTPPPLNIVGKIQIDDPSLVTVSVQFADSFTLDSDGKLDKILPLDVQRLKVIVNAAGYKPSPFMTTLRVEDAKRQRLTMADELKFVKTDTTKPAPGKIDPGLDNVKLEPLHQP